MARVRNLRSYDAVSRDVGARWAFPLAPDTCALPPPSPAWGRPTYRASRSGVYREQGVSVARGARVGPDAVVGAGATVADGAVVSGSVVGRDARLGARSAVVGSYIGDGAIVGDGASVTAALVCARAVVGARATVSPGAVLSFGVVVAPGAVVPAHARLSLVRPGAGGASDESDSDAGSDGGGAWRGPRACDGAPPPDVVAAAEAAAAGRAPPSSLGFDAAVVGAGGAGYLWPTPPDAALCGITPPPYPPAAGDDDGYASDASSADAAPAAGGDGGEGGDSAAARSSHFLREVAETFLRALLGGHGDDSLVLELNALKLAEVASFADCARGLAVALLDLASGPPPPGTRPEYETLYPETAPDTATPTGRRDLLGRLRALLARWAPLLTRYAADDDDQVELLLTLEDYCSADAGFEGRAGPRFVPIFAETLKLLYDADAVSERALLAWADEKAGAAPAERAYAERAAPLIEWLRDAESESSSEEDE